MALLNPDTFGLLRLSMERIVFSGRVRCEQRGFTVKDPPLKHMFPLDLSLSYDRYDLVGAMPLPTGVPAAYYTSIPPEISSFEEGDGVGLARVCNSVTGVMIGVTLRVWLSPVRLLQDKKVTITECTPLKRRTDGPSLLFY